MSLNGNGRYVLRYMRVEDIAQVTEVDKLSFPLPWSPRSYAFEISENRSGHMIVVETSSEVPTPKGLMGVIQRLGGTTQPAPAPVIAGYGGFWLIDGESHVSTIAVHPNFRGKKLGELLLAGMLQRSMDLAAEYSVLEVRVSNQSAINLYTKYDHYGRASRPNRGLHGASDECVAFVAQKLFRSPEANRSTRCEYNRGDRAHFRKTSARLLALRAWSKGNPNS